jgi:hypothetical protein
MAMRRTRKRWASERFIPIATARRRGQNGAALLLWHRFTPQTAVPIATDAALGHAPGEWYVATRPAQTFDEAFAVRASDLVQIRRVTRNAGRGAPLMLKDAAA